MVRIAIVSDTHVPSRAAGVPEWVRDEIGRADRVVHAGDFDSADAYDRIERLAGGDLTAVRGNTDPFGLDLPDIATLSVEGVTFVVTHGSGPRRGYRDRVVETVRSEAPDADDAIGVAGHTHEVVDERVDGVRLLNPGSATGAAPASTTSMMIAEIEGDEADVTVLER